MMGNVLTEPWKTFEVEVVFEMRMFTTLAAESEEEAKAVGVARFRAAFAEDYSEMAPSGHELDVSVSQVG